MADKPTLYLETSIASYLAAFPSRDLVVAAHQQQTHEWWRRYRDDYALYVSELVLDEIAFGDPEAVLRRQAIVADIPILSLTDETEDLARLYIRELALPIRAQVDAVHIACAVSNDVDYLVTWNCAHIANGLVIAKLNRLNRAIGAHTPVIVTPTELLGEYEDV